MLKTSLTFGLQFGENVRNVTFEPFYPYDLTGTHSINAITQRIKNFNNSGASDEPFASFKAAVCDSDGTPFTKIASFVIDTNDETELNLS